MNSKGFTLIELLAIVLILALIMGVGTYSVVTYIKTAREKSDQILVENIKTASKDYMEECSSGISSLECNFNFDNSLSVTLQDLADYGFLSVTVKDSNSSNNASINKVLNSKQEDISNCIVYIYKNVSTENYTVSYDYSISEVDNVSGNKCPTF